MPEHPLVYLAKDLNEQDLKKEVAQKVASLPPSIEGVKIKKPAGESFKTVELKFSDEAELAARELYQKLREAAALKPDLILFKKQAWQTGEAWSAFLDRIYRASTIRIE